MISDLSIPLLSFPACHAGQGSGAFPVTGCGFANPQRLITFPDRLR
jgi:hypothetical protein